MTKEQPTQEQIKICPLTRQAGYNAGFNPESNSNNCIEERCAWWCLDHSRCSIPAISYSIDNYGK